MNDLTKQELSLLLFLETRAVDYGGRVDTRHMNMDDMTTANRMWVVKRFQTIKPLNNEVLQ